MKLIGLLSGIVFTIVLLAGNAVGVDEVTLNNPPAVVYENCVTQFNVKFIHTPGDGTAINGFTTGFRIWTSNNGYTNRPDSLTYDSIPLCWSRFMDGGVFPESGGNDGFGEDTVGLGGFAIFQPGFNDGFNQTVFTIGVAIGAQAGDTLCIDSSFYEAPVGNWLWNNSTTGAVLPTWGGAILLAHYVLSEPQYLQYRSLY